MMFMVGILQATTTQFLMELLMTMELTLPELLEQLEEIVKV
jgi:hypothetical protein